MISPHKQHFWDTCTQNTPEAEVQALCSQSLHQEFYPRDHPRISRVSSPRSSVWTCLHTSPGHIWTCSHWCRFSRHCHTRDEGFVNVFSKALLVWPHRKHFLDICIQSTLQEVVLVLLVLLETHSQSKICLNDPEFDGIFLVLLSSLQAVESYNIALLPDISRKKACYLLLKRTTGENNVETQE